MSLREDLIAAAMKSMDCTREQAEVIVDRVGERLGGATHEEAVAMHPYPAGGSQPCSCGRSWCGTTRGGICGEGMAG